MFLDGSRYADLPTDEVTTPDGRTVTAVRLRRLPHTPGRPHTVLERDRLDLLAHAHLDDPEAGWRIGDANRALDARTLTARTGAVIQLPEAP